jgi:hypothetical protein
MGKGCPGVLRTSGPRSSVSLTQHVRIRRITTAVYKLGERNALAPSITVIPAKAGIHS